MGQLPFQLRAHEPVDNASALNGYGVAHRLVGFAIENRTRRPVAQRLVQPLLVVEPQPAADASARLRNRAIGFDEHVLVLQTPPQPLNEDGRGSFSADFGLHGRVKPPACEGRILVGGPPVRKVVSLCVSLARLGSLWLKRSQTQQGEPVRMALPSHYFARAFALALRASTADEAVMVQVKLQ